METQLKTFKLRTSFRYTIKKYFSSKFAFILTIFFIAIVVFFEMEDFYSTLDETITFYIHPLPSGILILSLAPISLAIFIVIGIIETYFKKKPRVSTFYNNYFRLNKKKYVLDKLLLIRRPSYESDYQGDDYIVLEFNNNSKVRFTQQWLVIKQ